MIATLGTGPLPGLVIVISSFCFLTGWIILVESISISAVLSL